MKPREVAYFGIADTSYPRNSRVRHYLGEELGYEVVIADAGIDSAGVRGKVRRLLALARGTRGASAVVLAEFASKYALPAWLITRLRGQILVIDGFVGLYETNVEDWGRTSPRSALGLIYRGLDWVALRCADVYLIDTEVRAQALARRRSDAKKVMSLPVGAPGWARSNGEKRLVASGDRLRLLYYGNYIPLHGLGFVVEALADPRLKGRVVASFIGNGGLRMSIVEQVAKLGLTDSIKFIEPVPEDQLYEFIRSSDVVLGVFGTSAKAQSVIANKVWQGLASGRVVLTQASEALHEISPLVGSQLRTVARGGAATIAEELIVLADQGATESEYLDTDARLEAYVRSSYSRLAAALNQRRRFGRGG